MGLNSLKLQNKIMDPACLKEEKHFGFNFKEQGKNIGQRWFSGDTFLLINQQDSHI